ncbi:MAG: hypothetical protein IJ461_08170 [Clostridia bacterium]|nr:hypothetical protein [Clostridia bacterium]
MKKLLLLALTLCLMLTCALAEDDHLVGTWTISHAEAQGITLGAEALGNNWLIDLNVDKTVVITMEGESAKGTWRTEGGQLLLNNGVSDMAFLLSDEGFYMEQDGAKIHFAKVDTAAQPAASADADPTGVWTLTTVESLGISMKASDVGLDVVYHLNADGTMSMTDSGVSKQGTWEMKDGLLSIDDGDDVITCTLEGDTLHMEMEGVKAILTREGAAVAAQPAAAGEGPAGYWELTSAEASGITMEASAIGIKMSFQLYEDGTLTATFNDTNAQGSWEMKEGVLYINDGTQTVPCVLEGDTFYLEQENAKMIFTRTGTASKAAVTNIVDTTQVAAMEAPAKILAQDVAEFNGQWVNAFMIQNGMRIPLSMINMSSSMEITDGKVVIDINGSVNTLPLGFVDGTLYIAAGENDITVALHEGGLVSFTTNGQSFYYEKMN